MGKLITGIDPTYDTFNFEYANTQPIEYGMDDKIIKKENVILVEDKNSCNN